VGLATSKDSANYAGGSIATRRKSFTGQVEGDDPNKKIYPGPPGWGVGHDTDDLAL